MCGATTYARPKARRRPAFARPTGTRHPASRDVDHLGWRVAENARLAAVEGRVEFLHYDLAALARAPFLTRATVIYMYLMPKVLRG